MNNYIAANLDVAIADLYTFALVGGTVIRSSGWVSALTIPQVNFPGSPLNYAASGNLTFALGAGFGRSKISTKIGTQPAELDITIYSAPGYLAAGSFTWQQLALAGLLDGASVELDRFFMPLGSDGVAGPLDTSLGCITWFYGKVADIDFGRSSLVIKVRSLMNLLAQQQMPRRLYESACTHIFGDAMCQFNRSSLASTCTAGSGSGQYQINTGLSPSPPTQYDGGTILGTSGANNGITRTIAGIVGGVAYLRRQFPSPVTVGDGFTLLPGCDHTTARCNQLGNLIHFGGFPHIPPPEVAV